MPTAPLEWFAIDDFRPGIHHKPGKNLPPGAATVAVRCLTNESGALVPGPRLTETVTTESVAPVDEVLRPLEGKAWICGIFANGPVFAGIGNPFDGPERNNSEIWVAFSWVIDGTPDATQYYLIARYHRNFDLPVWSDVFFDTAASASSDEAGQSELGPPQFTIVSTRANRATPLEVGAPVLAWCFGPAIPPMYFPDETTPISNSDVEITHPGVGLPQTTFIAGHQGRIIGFPINVNGMGEEPDSTTPIVSVTTEAFYFTRVNDHTQLEVDTGYFDLMASTELATGYGAVESMTADQVVLFKTRGGAVKITGPLDDPIVEYLPFVKSVGFARCQGTRSPVGYLYPVDNSGVWKWDGGDASTPISQQLNDDFWKPVIELGYYTAYSSCSDWGDWAVFPNGYLYDTLTDSWWRFDDVDTWHHSSDWTARWLYTTRALLDNGGADEAFLEYDRRRGALDYLWKSHPLSFSREREVNVRRVEIVASGRGSITVTLEALNRAPATHTLNIDSDHPIISTYAFDMSMSGTHVTVTVEAEGVGVGTPETVLDDGDAPTVHEVCLGYQPTHETRKR